MKSDKGEITIELIVGGIIFIVFIGVCIFMLTGENGIFVPKRDERITNNTTNEIIESNTTNNTVNEEQEENIVPTE